MLPKVRTETARKSFYFIGSKLFNDVPNELRDINSVMIFKIRILEFCRSQAFYIFLKLVAVFRLLISFIYLFIYLFILQGPY